LFLRFFVEKLPAIVLVNFGMQNICIPNASKIYLRTEANVTLFAQAKQPQISFERPFGRLFSTNRDICAKIDQLHVKIRFVPLRNPSYTCPM
jgi:hypothetical protein